MLLAPARYVFSVEYHETSRDSTYNQQQQQQSAAAAAILNSSSSSSGNQQQQQRHCPRGKHDYHKN
jgi:hypothetical protein